jgi:hypothetical protein
MWHRYRGVVRRGYVSHNEMGKKKITILLGSLFINLQFQAVFK